MCHPAADTAAASSRSSRLQLRVIPAAGACSAAQRHRLRTSLFCSAWPVIPPPNRVGDRMPCSQSRACARLRGCGVASTAAEMPRSQRREVVSTIGAVLPPPLPSPPMNEMQPCYAALPRGVLGWGRGVAGVGVLRTAFVRTHWHQVGRGAHHQVVCCVLMDAPVCCCVLQPPPRPRRWTPRPGRAAGDAVSACSSPPPRR